MPGLTLNTNSAPAHPTSSSSASQPHHPNANTPILPPQPQTQPQPQPQPQQTPPRRSSSPQRPTYSPITPPLNPVALPPRPAYAHASHRDAVAAPPPPPVPLDFDANPDVLALKSAISILQLQRRRAEADMAALARAKHAALAEPDAFVRDLTTGRVGVEGDRLFVGGVRTGGGSGSGSGQRGEDSGSDSSSDDDDDDAEMQDADKPIVKSEAGPDVPMADEVNGSAGQQQAAAANPRPPTSTTTHSNPSPGAGAGKRKVEDRPWAKLPKPQSVVRCPPINWSNYAVVGESLDKLHSEQLARPTQGTPAVVHPDGRYEFKGGDGKQERLVGVAAPYAPGRDRLDKKPKGSSSGGSKR
ncbi:hypothetical protein Hte_000893 [Hypoxylon texense]